ncbi:MAG: 50S ribosomal protein L11 methyltransferase [Prevotella sp.]|nr:50S ribosomal protein L11 methyltransferase [Bacteroides sp.]MCM1365794.1 50S ribosomal protein L11 methyltransferase [Prevotella sp.]MCM1436514.1 50S ribosomal protein L11 methyltransferase [Prevotella sp.]
MNDYYSVRFDVEECTSDYTDLLAAYLADEGYESFVPDNEGMTAYIREDLWNLSAVNQIVAQMPMPNKVTVKREFIEGKDWNEEWEKNYFKPIVIEDKCVIHSTFHNDIPEAEYDILIDPKMAFGTGHHFTTRLMVKYLLENDLQGKSVIDMGTGTGILAALAAMRGAKRVDGIEIDPPAYENACENMSLNDVNVNIILGDAQSLEQLPDADLLLANINRNIILEDLSAYSAKVKRGGNIVLSGFYLADVQILREKGLQCGLSFVGTSSEGEQQWTRLVFVKD